jgi:hypothetical protein
VPGVDRGAVSLSDQGKGRDSLVEKEGESVDSIEELPVEPTALDPGGSLVEEEFSVGPQFLRDS